MAKFRDVPLSTSVETRIDEATGEELQVTTYKRGIWTRTEVQHSDIQRGLDALASMPSARQRFEAMAQSLRNNLERRGLPSDRTPRWIRVRQEEWRPFTEDDAQAPIVFPTHYQHWTSRARELAEPLSRERSGVELLHKIVSLLNRKDVDDHLWHFLDMLDSYAEVRFFGPVNKMATTGVAATRARANGPKARRQRSEQVRAIIQHHTEAYWSSNAAYRGCISTTAAQIRDDVNTALKAKELLPKSGRLPSAKTIADHIGKILRGTV